MMNLKPNPRFVRTPDVRDSEYNTNIFIRYKPAGYWTSEAVTLSIEFIGIERGEDLSQYDIAREGHWMKFAINSGSGGEDPKSGLDRLTATECFAAALNDAIQIVRDVQLRFLKGDSLVEISQSLFATDLPSSSHHVPGAESCLEVPTARLPNDVFMCNGRLWQSKAALEAYVKTLNRGAYLIEIEISRSEVAYWWFILKHARQMVYGIKDIPSLTQAPAQAANGA